MRLDRRIGTHRRGALGARLFVVGLVASGSLLLAPQMATAGVLTVACGSAGRFHVDTADSNLLENPTTWDFLVTSMTANGSPVEYSKSFDGPNGTERYTVTSSLPVGTVVSVEFDIAWTDGGPEPLGRWTLPAHLFEILECSPPVDTTIPTPPTTETPLPTTEPPVPTTQPAQTTVPPDPSTSTATTLPIAPTTSASSVTIPKSTELPATGSGTTLGLVALGAAAVSAGVFLSRRARVEQR